MSLLFQEQDKWAFANNYLDALRQNAKLAGMSDETFDKCLANEELQKAIVGDMAAASQKYKVESTPSFVFNGGQKVLVGAQPITEFEKAVAEVSAASPVPDAAPADTPTAQEPVTAAPTAETPTQ
jgi:protein-disulfide isomerase